MTAVSDQPASPDAQRADDGAPPGSTGEKPRAPRGEKSRAPRGEKSLVPPDERPRSGRGRPGRRMATWAALGAAAVVAALVAVFALSPQSTNLQPTSPLLGRPAPAAGGPVINGSGTTDLATLRGKWVLVNFFASWCGPCQAEMPQLQAFQQQHAAKGDASILGIEYDAGDAGAARSYLTAQHATWPVVNDAPADVSWGVHGIPESYLVAPTGFVVAKYSGDITAAQLNSEIASLTQIGSQGASGT